MELANLTQEQIGAIHDPLDRPFIALIESLSLEEKTFLYQSIRIKFEHRRIFDALQIPWVSDFEGYWKENHNCQEVTGVEEFGNDFANSHEFERYRLYYASKHPESIDIKRKSPLLSEFLRWTNIIHHIQDLTYNTPRRNN